MRGVTKREFEMRGPDEPVGSCADSLPPAPLTACQPSVAFVGHSPTAPRDRTPISEAPAESPTRQPRNGLWKSTAPLTLLSVAARFKLRLVDTAEVTDNDAWPSTWYFFDM